MGDVVKKVPVREQAPKVRSYGRGFQMSDL